jgi:hypothetical protein
MIDLSATAPALFALQIAAWLLGGALIGAAYFWTLRRNIELLAFGRCVLLLAVGLQAGRFLFLAGSLATIADRGGALPLLSAATGILVARTLMTTRLGVPT